MTQQLAVQNKQELMALLEEMGEFEVLGTENLEPGDTGQPPRLRISPLNKPIVIGEGQTAPAGTIVNTVTGKVYDNGVEVVNLKLMPHTRVMWPETYASDNDPICASDDGKTPSMNEQRRLTERRPGPCKTCNDAQWPVDGSPPCSDQRNFLVAVLEDDESITPAILTMQRTSTDTARQFTTLARMLNPKRPKSILVATKQVSDNRGSWFKYICTEGGTLDLPQRVALRELQIQLDNLTITADVGEQEPDAVPAPSGPAGTEEVDGGEIQF